MDMIILDPSMSGLEGGGEQSVYRHHAVYHRKNI